METIGQFLNLLLETAPELRPIYDEHLADYDEVLPHVLMGDVTRFIVSLHKRTLTERRSEQAEKNLFSILRILEDALEAGDHNLQELVVTSFLENLEQDDEAYESLKKLLGKELLRHLKLIEY